MNDFPGSDDPGSDESDDPHPAARVTISNEQSIAVDESRIIDIAERTASAEGAVGDISILLVGIERMSELNQRFMGADGPTDVLAFPIDGLVTDQTSGPVVIGEVVICPEVARAKQKSDIDEELDLLAAHGVLHLLGFDHEDEAGAERMRARELRVSGRAGTQAE
jgi:probable rRNA maturation factor